MRSCRPSACLPPRCENVGGRSCCTPSARNDRAISEVFRDRSARCAAVSRPFSPRGLLWLFLRKKEQENYADRRLAVKRTALSLRSLRSATIFLPTFGLTQKYQKVKHGEKPRVSSPSLAERAQKTALFAHPLRALATLPPLLPHFSQCGRAGLWPAKRDGIRCKDRSLCRIVRSCVLYFSAGQRPAYSRDVKMSGEEAAAHRAPGTIVRNSGVFRDRSARRAAASRPFSPRGLLWLFLRKKEQEKLAGRKLAAKQAVLFLRRLKPATIFFVLLA